MRKHFLVASVTLAAMIAPVLPAFSADTGTKWSYDGTSDGPDKWNRLNKDWAICKTGQTQSPINIGRTEPVVMHPLELNYNVSSVNVVNNGHTVQQDYAGGSMMRINGKSYQLKQFHVHTPSEHTVMGVQAPMEIQFVHAGPTGQLAIIGVLVKEGRANEAANEIWPFLPIEKGQRNRDSNVKINARDFMPMNKAFYRYMGSLTTPPCTEGVNWYVMKQAIEMSTEQINMVRSLIGKTNRPLQERNNRMILDTAN